LEGVLTSIIWNRNSTTWSVKLRHKHFGKQTQVGFFKQLSDATAAMKHLDEALKDKSKQEKVASVDEVIQEIKRKREFNACSHGGQWKRSEIESIL
jgi:cupin superfamily acireductone dioxygenase involved in methionine salvage